MISAELASKQVRRLGQMRGYPKSEPEALKELVKALQISGSEDQAKAVVRAFVDTATNETPCPFPGDIRRAVKAMQEESRPDPLCRICDGSGWRIITRAGLSGSDLCKCWAPRPAPKVEYVPLPGMAGYVADDKRTSEMLKASEVKL